MRRFSGVAGRRAVRAPARGVGGLLVLPALDGILVGEWDSEDYDEDTGDLPDLSGNDNAAAQGTASLRPVASEALGHVSMLFDGAGDRLTVTYPSAISQPDALFFVAVLTDDATGKAICDGIVSSNRRVIYWSGSVWQLFSNTGVSASGGNANDSSVEAHAALFDGADSEYYADDWDTDIVAGNPGTVTSTGLTFGAAFNGSVSFEGHMLYAIHVQNPSAADFTRVRNFFRQKYGLAVLA